MRNIMLADAETRDKATRHLLQLTGDGRRWNAFRGEDEEDEEDLGSSIRRKHGL